jgi:hypothetical protein
MAVHLEAWMSAKRALTLAAERYDQAMKIWEAAEQKLVTAMAPHDAKVGEKFCVWCRPQAKRLGG